MIRRKGEQKSMEHLLWILKDSIASGGYIIGIFISTMIICYLIQAISYYKIAEKANVGDRWLAFIPIAQNILFLHIIDKSGWYILIDLLGFIPVVGPLIVIIINCIWAVRFYQCFNTSTILIVLCVIIPLIALIYMLYLAFSNVQYIGTTKYAEM
jgi:hypothetical protein